MLKVANMVGLGEYVSIYVPSTLDTNKSIDNAKYVEKIQFELSKMFGGSTSYDTIGSFVADNNEHIVEKVTIVKAFSTKIDNEHVEKCVKLCEALKVEMSQYCISLEINGKLFFVE